MRKLFLLAVGLAMTLTACQKDEGLVSDGATSKTITVTIPQGMQTRATAADLDRKSTRLNSSHSV